LLKRSGLSQLTLPSASSLFAVAIGFSAAALATQSNPPQPQSSVPVIRANTHAVVVDVVVTKGQDEPVGGLHKQDFQLMEDGKPQPIDYFEEHSAPVSTADAPNIPLVPMPPHVYTNVPAAPPTDSVNILLLDSLNTDREDQKYVQEQVSRFFKTMKPDTRIAVFTLGSKLRLIQGFTSDSTAIQAAFDDRKNGASIDKPEAARALQDKLNDQQDLVLGPSGRAGVEAERDALIEAANFKADDRVTTTLTALQSLARYLAGIPGRKNLIWFAGSFPVTVFPSAKEKLPLDQIHQYRSAVRATADLLTLSKVAVYPVSAEGMMTEHMIMMGGWLPGPAGWGPIDVEALDANSKGQPDAPQRLSNQLGAYTDEAAARAAKMSAMEELAADTGGEAIFNNNDLAASTDRVINNGAHYYTIVYTPANKKMDGQFRHIEIKLDQSKYKLIYRRGYYADDLDRTDKTTSKSKASHDLKSASSSGDHPDATADPTPLRQLMARGMPSSTQILYGVRLLPATPQPEPTAIRAGYNAKLPSPTTRYTADFLIDWKKVQLQPASDGTHTGMIRLELLAYNRDGKALNWTGQTMGLTLDAKAYAAIQKSGIPAHLEIDVPNTDVYLATGIYDLEANKAGTLEIPLNSLKTESVTK
jgi:VWFA-related protein